MDINKNLPAVFVDVLATASVEMQEAMIAALQHNVEKMKPNPEKLVDFIPEFTTDSTLIDNLTKDLDDLHLTPTDNKSTASQWLSNSYTPYVFTDKDPIHSPKDINDYPSILQLMQQVNECDKVDGPLDSCLIIKYPSSSAATRAHADNEPLIDDKKSICSFTICSSGTIEFFKINKSSKSGKGKSKCVKSYVMNEGSLVVMRPGCQKTLNHCVRAERSSSECQVRYSISFRGTTTLESHITQTLNSPVKDLIKSFDEKSHHSSPPTVPVPDTSAVRGTTSPPTQNQHKQKICLVAGDSFAARLDVLKLGKHKRDVRSIAEGGFKIRDVEGSLEKFSLDNPDVLVEKLFVSVGSNDTRYCKNGVSHLKGHVKQLFRKIQDFYPDAKVFVQCVLPLPAVHKYVVKNVRGINDIIYGCCSHAHFYYMNILNFFLDERGATRNCTLFNVSDRDVHPNKKGLGVLARFYIFHIHSRRFNPLAY